jgi:miniconductance mechanosensitive channel
MSDSGGRRIKRSINIDMNSVGFLEPDDIGRLARWELLAEYIARKLKAIEEYNAGKALPSELVPHVRRLTNLGTFRAYVVNYLRSHPHIHKGMTLLVRQLDPTPHGIPLQLYVFSDDTAWVSYEGIQSDIFEHLLAVLPEFGLRVFQAPAGSDVQALMQPTPTTAVDRS